MTASAQAAKVCICIATYLRPVGLSRLMRSLRDLRLTDNAGVAVEIVVVDNDPCASARAAVEEMATWVGWPVRYEVEPRRGIPFARNRAVALAADADYVVFVDDDEVVGPSWLHHLLLTQRSFEADVVEGPALPIFESAPPSWVLEGRFFNHRRYPTGTRLYDASTSNTLVRTRVLGWIRPPFDPRFALNGGDDHFLFMQLARKEAHIVWCDEAVAHEFIPRTRANLRWLLQRAYRGGNSHALAEQFLDPSLCGRAARLLKGLVRIAQGLVGLGPSLALGRVRVARQLRYVALGVGMLSGAMGHTYEEYRAIHGA